MENEPDIRAETGTKSLEEIFFFVKIVADSYQGEFIHKTA
jgi:hypothetical protein